MTTTPGILLHAIKRGPSILPRVSGNIHKAGLNAIGSCPAKAHAASIRYSPDTEFRRILFCDSNIPGYLIVLRGPQSCYATGQPASCGLKGRGTTPSAFDGQSLAQAPPVDWLLHKAPSFAGDAFDGNALEGTALEGNALEASLLATATVIPRRLARMKRHAHAHVSNIVPPE